MEQGNEITDATLEALSRNFFKEASNYGFRYEHYLRFVNILLELAIEKNDKKIKTSDIKNAPNDLSVAKFPLESERLFIKEINKNDDITFFNEWLTDEQGKYFLQSLISPKILTLEDLINNDKNIVGLVTDKNSIPIGLMAYLNYDQTHRKAELRKIIGNPALRGKGFGKEATKLWIRYGQKILKLRKIFLYTIETNIRNIRLNEELGFKVEGILRNELYIDKTYHDVVRMGLLFE